MAPVLTPPDALDYVTQLSADVREGVVLGADGALLAGEESMATAARELLAATDAAEVEVATPRGIVFAARSASHAVVVTCGTFALSGLQRHDLRTLLSDLAGGEREAA